MRFYLILAGLVFCQSAMAQVTGYIDAVEKRADGAIVRGWACSKKLNTNIEVRIFAGGPAGIGVLIASDTTNVASSAKISSICATSAAQNHRFIVFIPKNKVMPHQGKKIFIHGISPVSNNLVIVRSGMLELPKYPPALQKVSFLQDTGLSHGITVKDPFIENKYTGKTYMENGTKCREHVNVASQRKHRLDFGNSAPSELEPFWQLAQWDSKANLYKDHGKWINEGTFAWENPYKIFQIGKPGYGHQTLTMGVDGHREYNGSWNRHLDPCVETPHPHILVEQSFPIRPDATLGSLKHLLFTLKARVLTASLDPKLSSQWNRNTNTAHFKVHMNIQNIRTDNDRTKGHGQSFGIGINLYDVRNRDSDYSENLFFHRPRRRVMLNLSIDNLGDNIRSSLHKGGRGAISQRDILPEVKRAFKLAIQAGKRNAAVEPLISENFHDYHLTSFNMGWEVSSPHVVEMQISDVELFGQK